MDSVFLKQLDRFFGRWVSFFLRNDKASSTVLSKHSKKVAIIRLWAIGESLLALPAIAALKQQRPGTKITVVTTPWVEAVFKGQDFIDEIHVIQPSVWALARYMLKHRKAFDVAIDFEPHFYASALLAKIVGKYSLGFDTLTRGRLYAKAIPYRDDQHVVKTNFDLVRAVGVEEEVPTNLVAVAGDPTSPRLRGAQRAVAIAPGGGVDFRRWPAERFAEVADYLVESYGYEILLVGDKADEQILRDVQQKMKSPAQIASNLSLPEVATLLSQCRLTIANDGGLMHVSAAMGTSTLGLFGPETPVRMGPYGPKNRALYHQLDGNPVIHVHRGITGGEVADRHPERFVQAITVEEVRRTADVMWQTELQPRK